MAVEIADWNDLDNVRNDLTGDYVLVNDLDSDTAGYTGIGDDFEPIALTSDFVGSFDGDGFLISDVVIEYGDGDNIGLFSSTAEGALIENLSVGGSVTVTNSVVFNCAGLVGRNDGATIQNCVSHIDVTVPDGRRLGGLVGFNLGTVTDSYATGSVEGDSEVGGLVGRTRETVQTSYAVGLVSGNEDVGGLVAFDRFGPNVSNSYADSESTGQDVAIGNQDDDDYTNVTTLTTAEMQGNEAETNMDGFDFADVWDAVLESDDDTSADGYPILLALNRENQLEAQGILDLTVDITGQITLDGTGVETADVIGFNLTHNEFGGKTETDTEGNYTLTVDGTEEGSGDTIAVAVDFDDGTERYGRVVTTVLE